MTPRRSTIRAIALTAALLVSLSPLVRATHGATAPVVSTLSSITTGISTPVRLATDQFGNIYVTDPRGGGIMKYNSAGKLLSTIRNIPRPQGVAVTAAGNLVVSSGTSAAIYDANGALLKNLGAGAGQFQAANGIALDAQGRIYVADSLGKAVQVFDANGTYVTRIGAGQLTQPTGIAYEKISDQLAVVDTLNGGVLFFSTSGVYQKTLGSFGSGPLKFTSPQSVAFEYSKDDKSLERIYVVDTYQGNVQVVDPANNSFAFLRYISSYGVASGKLVVPGDALFDRFDSLNTRLLVTNGTGALSIFGIDNGSGGTPAPSAGPALSINAVPLITNVNTLSINGTAASGATVTVNGQAAGLSPTTWGSTITLVSGVNVITVTASNSSGTTVKTVAVNYVAPGSGTAPLIDLVLAPLPALTGNAAITLSGNVTSGATVAVNGTAATVTGTTWSLPVTLAQGINNFLITANKAGLSDSATSVNITLDNTPPVLNSHLMPDGTTTGVAVQTISGSVVDANASTLTVTVNGAAHTVPVNDGTFSLAVILASGGNSVTVTATDAAGNASSIGPRTIVYDPQVPTITIASANGAVSGSSGYTLSGTVPPGSSVSVNGAPAAVSGPAWTAPVALAPGINYFEVKATDSITGKSSTVVNSVYFDQGYPSIAVTTPLQDAATAKSSYTLTGTVTPGSTVSATVNGTATPVPVAGNGTFSINLNPFAAPGAYVVTVNATDNFGNTSTTNRTLIYDPSVPRLTVTSTNPPKLTVTGGVLMAKDKNGPVGTVTYLNGAASIDLTGVAYDPASLNIYALSAAGTSTRDGDINQDGNVDIGDALLAMQTSLGVTQAPTFEQLLRADVGPLVNHEPTPDGKMRLNDVVVILHKVLGLDW